MSEKNVPPVSNSSSDDKIIAAISYIWILFFIPLFLKKDSQFCQFHAKQGLVLFVASILLWIINVIPFLGQIIFFFGGITLLILAILGFINAFQGRKWVL